MATLTTFRSGGVCSECRAYGRLDVINDFGGDGATYRIGDRVDGDVGDDFATHSYVVREPQPGEPARVLCAWTCDTCRRYSFAELSFSDGRIVDLQAVELTLRALDRIHYIAKYDSSELETLIGHSMWDEQGVWPGWLSALRDALERREAASPEVHEAGAFPLGGVLDNNRYKIVEHYLGGGFDQLWFARSADEPDARFLVSTTIDNGFDRGVDAPPLMRKAAGLFTPRFVGSFDPAGDNGVEDQVRLTTLAYVEQVPPGWPLPLTTITPAPHAFRLGAQVAEKLVSAAADGMLAVGLRPEYVWVTHGPGAPPDVTAISGRNDAFFMAATRRRDLRTARLFTRGYVAPEVQRGNQYDDRALVLTIGVMTAEWLLGRYPYEEDDGKYGYIRLCKGEHVELPPSARELSAALNPDPAERPTLRAFAQTLARLAVAR